VTLRVGYNTEKARKTHAPGWLAVRVEKDEPIDGNAAG
jgi:hypothetical protein